MLVQRVLREAAFTMRHIAESAGVAYTTVRRWSVGDRVPDVEHRARLAAALRRKSEQLADLADELEREGRDG